MLTATTITALNHRLAVSRLKGHTIGFIPTMGALHAGHLRLIEEARRHTDVVVVSIFVNPLQFNHAEDFAHYPRTLEQDAAMCAEAGVGVIFAPGAHEMYPQPLATLVEVPPVSEQFCGRFRPGHFRGVATVVMKLFQIVRPDFAYFGEKDAQQLAVIRRMVKDLNVPVTVVPVPTLREPDGLALSSRNQRLGVAEREIAPLLCRALLVAAEEIRLLSGVETALAKARAVLAAQPGIQVEYLEVADPDEMQPVAVIHGPVLVMIAAWLGGVRLIDNLPAFPGSST